MCCIHCVCQSPSTADIISAVEFDHTGDHLATGDRGGRVVLFEHVIPEQVSIVSVSNYTIHSVHTEPTTASGVCRPAPPLTLDAL